ncbi:hypothetical protein EVAR_103015_1 [Eumeta japonica]|uniref:Uncharacterized protein n=1 Tax=Eumeta variegata TaxID=151549 RepID=A0A4C1WCM5_EUMVA|nr:hypothetical protein EVAR_103015_1 [Eumeta japonica]
MFVDASERSYAAAVYWRVKLSKYEIVVLLIIGNVRVAPLKIIPIPRLELQAALLGARLTSSILNDIELNEEPTMVKYWRCVPTKVNVTDDVTRGPPTNFDKTYW